MVGCELIVRGVSPQSGQTAADVVRKAVQDATMSSTDFTLRIRDRELFKVLIATAGSRAERDSYCYVWIAPDVAVASSDPRPDLLAQWIEVISTLNNQWSVDWSPQRAGKDKSTWVSLQGISSLDGDAREEFGQMISAQLEHLGYAVSSSWPMDKGRSAGVILRNPGDVSRIKNASPLTIPSLSSNPIYITTPFRQIQPIYVFEMVVLGISAYDPLFHSTLNSYFIHRTRNDAGTSSFVSSCTLWEDDAYCFTLSDGKSTAFILSDAEMFQQFTTSHQISLQPPQLIYRANTDGTLTNRPSVTI